MDGLTGSILGKDFSTLASIPVSAYADYGSDSTLVNGYYEEMDTSLDFVIPLDDYWKPPDDGRLTGGSWASTRAHRTR